MASYIGSNETLPQIVITPNKGMAREGYSKQSAETAQGEPARMTPAQVRNKSAITGREAAEAKTPEAGENGFWGTDGFTFGDLIDIINPLQHIPIVSTAYRAITGDEIGAGPRMLGGALMGGVAGFAAAAVGAAVEGETGMDVGDHVMVALGIKEEAQVSIAAKQAQETGATLLSSKDAVTRVSEDIEFEAALAEESGEVAPEPPMTAQEALLAAGIDPITLERDELSRNRAAYALGGLEQATSRYQQMQMNSRMQDVAMSMDISG